MPSFNYKYAKNRKKPNVNEINESATIPKAKTGPFYVKIYQKFNDLLFNPDQAKTVICCLIPIEIIINILIVFNVNYTEIDWKAYMQEVEGVLNGTFNYYELKGDTGPLVYPAGFVYIYMFFYAITNKGQNVRLAQFVFIALYMIFIQLVFFIYTRSKKVPPIAYIIMCLMSHRIHSIFVLRLFNDPIAMLFLYAAISCILVKWWRLGCILFSLAVSIKMNILLFAPGLFIVLVLSHGFFGSFGYIALCAVVQLILGLPFLINNPIAYIHRAFEFSRQFLYKWTVNWKCVPEDIFLSRVFQLALLSLHLIMLFLFLNKILRNIGGLKELWSNKRQIRLNNDFIILTMFVSNFIGIVFSRSLHYQFYVWYYHTIAYLVWYTPFPNAFRFLIFGLIEMCWNIYPPVMVTSLALHASHLVTLFGLWNSLNSNSFNLKAITD